MVPIKSTVVFSSIRVWTSSNRVPVNHWRTSVKTFFLLVLLTQNGAGDINASFVNTKTLEQCQKKSVMVEAVFKTSNVPVIESRCIKSDLKFSEFGHASSSSMINYFYLVKFDNTTVQINRMPDWSSCITQAKPGAVPGMPYCSSSVQLLKE